MLTNDNFFAGVGGIAPSSGGSPPTRVNLAMMPMFHIAGAGWAMVGLVLRLPHRRAARRRPGRASWRRSPSYGITNAFMVPAVIQFLLMTPGVETTDFSSAARARLRRLADHRRGARQGHGDVRLRVHPGLRPDRDHRRHHPARRRRPRSGEPAAAAALVRQALPVGRDAHRRRATATTCPPAQVGELWTRSAPEHGRLLEQPGGHGRRRSRPTAGSRPATPATSTTTASCTCTTG